MSAKTFTQNTRRPNCVGPVSNLSFVSKVDSILKLSNCYEGTQIPHVFRTKLQKFRPFVGDRPWHLAHVFDKPLPSHGRFFFRRTFLALLRPQYPQTNTEIKISSETTRKKKKKKRFVNGWVTGRRTRVPKISGSLQKTAWTLIACWTNLGRYAWTSR